MLCVAGNDVPVVCLVSSGTWRRSVLSAVCVTQKVSVFMMAMKNKGIMMNAGRVEWEKLFQHVLWCMDGWVNEELSEK